MAMFSLGFWIDISFDLVPTAVAVDMQQTADPNFVADKKAISVWLITLRPNAISLTALTVSIQSESGPVAQP